MYISSDLRSAGLSDISNKTVAQNRRASMTSVSTEITCIDFKSPSAKKPCVFKSPGPCTRTHIENLFSVPQRKKRARDEVCLSENKKIKGNFGPVTKLVTELFDPDAGKTLGFRCFREKEIIQDMDIENNIIKNDCDDDCPTDELQIEVCTDFLIKEIEEALNKYDG